VTVDVRVPDIGDFSDVAVIEVLVKPGDTVAVEQSLITIESDKASMEIPSSHAGVVKELKVAVGDKVNEGTLILRLEGEAAATAAPAAAAPRGRRRPPPRRSRSRRPCRLPRCRPTSRRPTRTLRPGVRSSHANWAWISVV
jgi:pyruvate/2-oxoglutarate dehydrogenase complex dihydrolipoamide acyltransferase (E2) component